MVLTSVYFKSIGLFQKNTLSDIQECNTLQNSFCTLKKDDYLALNLCHDFFSI